MTLAEKVDQVPDRPGVYLYKDAKAQIIYIGKAASLRSRVRSYFQESRARDAKTDALVGQIRDLEYIVTANELEALILESNAGQEAPAPLQHHPAGRQALPVPQAHHQRGVSAAAGGPAGAEGRRDATSARSIPRPRMRETLRLVRQLFPLRTCRIKIDGTLARPCLQYFIHRCNAPVHGMGDARGLRQDGQGRGALPRGQERRPRGAAHRARWRRPRRRR